MMPLNKSWDDYNKSLIERGRVLMDISFLRSSRKEIKKMNNGKVGALSIIDYILNHLFRYQAGKRSELTILGFESK